MAAGSAAVLSRGAMLTLNTITVRLGGNLILSVKDSRIALDKTMAMRIMV